MILPNPDLFVYAFMRQEAVLSSQIEGTQASLEDLLEFEADVSATRRTDDVAEVVNYIDAMNWGMEQLTSLPVCIRLIKGLHARLLKSGRGAERNAGEFRENQNWIGPSGCSIQEATFVPPPVPEMIKAIGDWETFLNAPTEMPTLVKCALAHAQFETIHPFWDGNGRLGRMVITFFLCAEGIISKPILYLSLFFKQHREQYYELLQATRDEGNWEDWILFFLRGVTATSRSALSAAGRTIELRESLLTEVHTRLNSNNAPVLVERLFYLPYVTVTRVSSELEVTYPTAKSLVDSFVGLGILREVSGRKRDRVFGFLPYLEILHSSAGE